MRSGGSTGSGNIGPTSYKIFTFQTPQQLAGEKTNRTQSSVRKLLVNLNNLKVSLKEVVEHNEQEKKHEIQMMKNKQEVEKERNGSG